MEKPTVTKQIKEIEFGLISPTQIKKMATVHVLTPELYDADGYPVEKGLMDLAMGVIDPGLRCKTCGGKLRTCLGHFGYIQLARPVIHVFFANEIHNALRSFCSNCGRILVTEDLAESWREKILKAKKEHDVELLQELQKSYISKLRKIKRCPHCDAKQLDVKLEKPTTFYEGGRRLWPTEIRERLEKIPDKDLEVLGYDPVKARPEWAVLTMLLIPPITVRPSITLVTGERSEDDLTHKLSDIVRVNQRLMENINAGAPEIIIEDLWDLLQYHITTYFDNEIAGVPPARHKSNRPLKTLAQRIKGKEGRFRGNLAGKRVNFCARSVISPDPLIEIDEVGVPLYVARELTVPEMITEWNLKHLKKFVKRGDDYPGASYVISPNGRRKRITEDTKEQILEELSPGWIVERHMLDGDVVLFNRQPSLHRLSMMAHKVRILPGKTLRINPAVCVPYNADFDGDEMNLHLPQTEEARAEAKHLLEIKHQIITPRYGLAIIGEVEDALVGLQTLLEGNLYLNKEEVCQLLANAGIESELPKPEKRGKKPLWNGRQIFSLLLPEDLNFETQDFKTVNGKLVDYSIKDQLIGLMLAPEKGVLIHYLFKKYGPDFTKDFIDKANRLGLAVSQMFPYSFSFRDLDLDVKIKKKIRELLAKGERDVQNILRQYKEGKIIPLPGKTERETTEARILSVLNKIRSEVGELVKRGAKKERSNLIRMARCGLVKLLHLALMSGFVGQQSLRGKRISLGYRNRTLSHFERGDYGAKARGFIFNGYIDGLDPIETFFHAIVGRDALMDTALRTPASGYMQRRLINALQDLKVHYDGTVRDSAQRIIQFKFAGDGIDVSKSYHGGLNQNV